MTNKPILNDDIIKGVSVSFAENIGSPLNIVVSRYNRDTSWTEKFKTIYPECNIIVYDKEKPENPYNVPVNKGNEASAFLKYIIDHYGNLPEYTFFCHDEEFAWHHSGSIINHFEIALLAKRPYYNVNDKIILGDIKGNDYGYQPILDWYSDFIEPYIPFKSLPNEDWTSGYRGSAQFLVHKNIIHNLPKVFYERIYTWMISTHLTSALTGRYLEWTWHLFWYIYPTIILKNKLSDYSKE